MFKKKMSPISQPFFEGLESRTLLSTSINTTFGFMPNADWSHTVAVNGLRSNSPQPQAAPGDPAVAAPILNVSIDGTRVNDSDTVNFGTHVVGGANSKTLTITNGGDADLTVSLNSIPAGYTLTGLTGDPASVTVTPGSHVDLTLSINNLATGNYSGPLKLNSNDPNDSVFQFQLTGAVRGSALTVNDIHSLALNNGLVSGGVKNFKQYVSIQLANNSDKKMGGTAHYALYASTNPVLNIADTANTLFCGNVSASAHIAAQGTKDDKVRITVPAVAATGQYYIFAVPTGKKVDPNSGGRAATAIDVVPPYVSLADNKYTPPLDVNSPDYANKFVNFTLGKKGTLTIPINNGGNVPANGKAFFDVFLTHDGTLNNDQGFAFQTFNNVSIKVSPSGSKVYKLKLVFPRNLPAGFTPGKYFIAVKVRCTGDLATLNKLNECVVAAVPANISA